MRSRRAELIPQTSGLGLVETGAGLIRPPEGQRGEQRRGVHPWEGSFSEAHPWTRPLLSLLRVPRQGAALQSLCPSSLPGGRQGTLQGLGGGQYPKPRKRNDTGIYGAHPEAGDTEPNPGTSPLPENLNLAVRS